MATPTYTLIEEQILGSAQASVTFGSGGTIPQTYTDLFVEMAVGNSASGNTLMKFNSSTTGYSSTGVAGSSSGATSWRLTNNSIMYLTQVAYGTTSGLSSYFASIMSYKNTSVYKTVLARSNNAAQSGVEAVVGLWQNTAAITSITIQPEVGNFATNSTFRLWGIA